MSDDSLHSTQRPANSLLDELESIKGALADGDTLASNNLADEQESDLPGNIPLLDDMVIDNLNANAALLNIDRIFGDDSTAAPMQFPRFTLDVELSGDHPAPVSSLPLPPPVVAPVVASAAIAASKPRAVRRDYSRELLIQELVDEFIPQIEMALHERLSQLDDAALQRLLKNSK